MAWFLWNTRSISGLYNEGWKVQIFSSYEVTGIMQHWQAFKIEYCLTYPFLFTVMYKTINLLANNNPHIYSVRYGRGRLYELEFMGWKLNLIFAVWSLYFWYIDYSKLIHRDDYPVSCLLYQPIIGYVFYLYDFFMKNWPNALF